MTMRGVAAIPVVSDAALHTARSSTRDADVVLREIPTSAYDRSRAQFTLMDKLTEEQGWKSRRSSSARVGGGPPQ